MTPKIKKYLLSASRILVALLFIFSGLSKAIDPWGTAFVIEEYLLAYGMEGIIGWSIALSMAMSTFEVVLGAAIAMRVMPRFVSLLTLVVMSLFTIVTLLSATVFSIADCGCFGEVLKLSPWATFAKNIFILPFTAILWWYSRHDKWFSISTSGIVGVVATIVISFGITLYSYLYLPLIDLTPYHKGVNLYELVYGNIHIDQAEDTYLYKSLADGTTKEFTLAELDTLNEAEWEWIETREGFVAEPQSALKDDFFIVDSAGDATEDILSRQGAVYLICVTDFDAVPVACAERLKRVVIKAELNDDMVIVLTPDNLQGITYYSFANSPLVRCYNIDGRVMKNLLRAKNGLVVLNNGIVTEKYNCRSVDF